MVPHWCATLIVSFGKFRRKIKERMIFYTLFITFIVLYISFFSNLPLIVAQTAQCPYTLGCVPTGACTGESKMCRYEYSCPSGECCCCIKLGYSCGDNFECCSQKCCFLYGSYFCAGEYEECSVPGDEDCDGLADCADPDCAGKTGPTGDICCQSASDCPSKDNKLPKCDPTQHICKWPPCNSNSDCVDGACCDKLVGGSGNCVSAGSIYGSKYLCDPPGWSQKK
jgi:hypothetical protein